MPEEKSQVIIEMQLKIKELQSQMKDAKDSFKDLKKNIEKSMGMKEIKKLIEAIEDLTDAVGDSTKAFTKGEQDKQKAIKKTTDALKDQQKAASKWGYGKGGQGLLVPAIGGILGKTGAAGRFVGGLGAGMGLGALGRQTGARQLGGMLGRGITAGVGGLASFITSGAAAAYGQYQAYGQALGGLVGMGTPGQMRGGLRAAGGVGGAGLGYGPIATAMQARGIGRAAGNIGAVYRGQQFARAYGMDVGEVTPFMGMMRQAGYGFGGQRRNVMTGGMEQVDQRGSRELQKVMEAGLMSGIEKARLPEFLQGVAQITQQVGSRISGDVNVAGIARFQAMLGRTGAPGFQGARGAAVAAQLGSAITRPGGGEAGQAMMLQALGFGKPGGTRTYYDALKMQQQGLERPESVLDMFNEVYSQLGQKGAGGTASVNQEANLALSKMTGLSLDQIETLGDLINSGLSQEELLAEINEQTKKAEPVEKQALKTMKEGFGGMVSYLAGIEAKQIAIGSRFAKMFQTIQELQLKALKWFADYMPKIEHWLKEAYMALKEMINIGAAQLTTDERKKYESAMKESRKEMEETYGKVMTGSVADRLKALKDQENILKQRLGTLMTGAMKGGAGGGVIARGASEVTGWFGEGEGANVQAARRREARDIRAHMLRIQKQRGALTEAATITGMFRTGKQTERYLDILQNEGQYGRQYSKDLKRKLRHATLQERLSASEAPVVEGFEEGELKATGTRRRGVRRVVSGSAGDARGKRPRVAGESRGASEARKNPGG